MRSLSPMNLKLYGLQIMHMGVLAYTQTSVPANTACEPIVLTENHARGPVLIYMVVATAPRHHCAVVIIITPRCTTKFPAPRY